MNVGTGEDQTIEEIAGIVSEATGYTGSTEWDTSKPDGTPRKLLDVSTLRDSGWESSISLRDGIGDTLSRYRSNHAALRV